MRLSYLFLFCLNVFFQSTSWSATLCHENRTTQSYVATNQTNDCVLPEALIRSAPPFLARSEAGSMDSNNKWDLRVEDGSVYAALKRWSAIAGWQISWEIPVDFPIEILDSSNGKFEDAVRRVLTAFKVADYPPYPCFHENNVVRIVRRIQGNEAECQ